ncbi:hypothetical protein Ahy_A09g045198 [Arachis hypogaea]|uniref:Serine hydroxymethyltransferase-like domain-containing protein n=1 Tax=Arachis hypogaea TaxID=3818 RepID=A0A445BLT8_ARAHY|nr:hypothetical protein Ahy_A09g045198 [Arachis hypogaea]
MKSAISSTRLSSGSKLLYQRFSSSCNLLHQCFTSIDGSTLFALEINEVVNNEVVLYASDKDIWNYLEDGSYLNKNHLKHAVFLSAEVAAKALTPEQHGPGGLPLPLTKLGGSNEEGVIQFQQFSNHVGICSLWTFNSVLAGSKPCKDCLSLLHTLLVAVTVNHPGAEVGLRNKEWIIKSQQHTHTPCVLCLGDGNGNGASLQAFNFHGQDFTSSLQCRYTYCFNFQAERKKNQTSIWPKQLNASLEEVDPEIADIIELEKARQWKGLEVIPSKNFTSVSVMEAVGSIMTSKYSEGYPGASILTWLKHYARSVPWKHSSWIQLNESTGYIDYDQLKPGINVRFDSEEI